MAIQIQFRRGTAYEWSHVNPILALAEMGIETDTKLFKIGTGALHWNDLDYGGVRGYVGSQGNTGYVGSAGSIAVDNVLYVSKSGNDSFDGRSLSNSKLTIKAALAIATRGTTIFVKSGDYTELNPLTVPDFVSVIGDNLRSVTVRPSTVTSDLFYVNNGCYIAHMTFKDHVSPAAAVAFPPDGSAGVISTSPYVQNCTSLTSSGTGMRVDGSHALGTKSMMVDAFTQYNQGGIGIHMLNSGYTSLVSVFTICCDIGFLCETGGFCSITNSNSSFGNYALYADGVGETLYTARLNGSQSGRTLILDNLTTKPSIGDAISLGDGNYYTIATSTSLNPGTAITYPYLLAEDATLRNARQDILDAKTRFQVEVINHLQDTYPGFDFNHFKCSRDVGTIIDSISYDMVLDTNYQTIQAGTSYYRATSTVVINGQLTETVNAIAFLKSKTLSILTPSTTAYTRVSNLFDTLLDILANGFGVVPAYTFNSPTGADANVVNAGLRLQANKDFIAEETVAYTSNFTYNTSTCARDTGLIVDSIAFDLLYGGTSQSVFAGLQYWNQSGLVDGVGAEFIIINNSFLHLKNAILDITAGAGGTTASNSYSSKFDSLLDIFNNGITGATDKIQPNGFVSTNTDIIAGYNAVIAAKTTLQTDTINWINTTNPGFSYNTATCYRDLGYIIDSTSFDVLHGGNRQSIMSGVYYYSYNSTSTAIPREVPQVIAAYEFINTISADIVKGNLITATYQTLVMQTISTSTATNAEVRIIDKEILTITNIIVNGPSVAPSRVPIGLTASTSTSVINAFNLLLANRDFIKSETIAYINTSYVGLVYSTATCKRDVGYIIDSVTYDLLYQGNSQSIQAAKAYYDGAVFRISDTEKNATVAAYDFIKTIIGDIIVDNPITPLQNAVTQDLALIPATSVEAIRAQSLVYIIENVVKNAFSSTITIQENIANAINDNTVVTFHKYSQIQSSSHNFEWIGAGTNINAALPYLGGTPVSDNQAVAVNGGKVYFTGTDQQGDFRIGNGLVINNNIGTISGRTFTKSLFAVMTPYILAIGR
jgi:hypothetical protein